MRDPTGPLCPWGDKWGQIRAARAKQTKKKPLGEIYGAVRKTTAVTRVLSIAF